MRRIISCWAPALMSIIAVILTGSCKKERKPSSADTYDNVLLIYSAGYNDLSSDLEDDIDDIRENGYVPKKNSRNALLVLSKRIVTMGNYVTKTPASLVRLYSDSKGGVVSDTVKVWPKGTIAADANTVNEVLGYVRKEFPASGYGMIFSSHASGWLPKGYYTTGKITSAATTSGMMSPGLSQRLFPEPVPVPYAEPEEEPGAPRVRSIGMDRYSTSLSMSYEMELETFAEAIPMTLDYIIFDSCLMGGVEVAYALREKCGKVIFAPTETMADGLCDYTKVTGRLLKGSSPDLLGICEDSYAHYTDESAQYKYLTISMVDCAKTEALAEECRKLFSDYRAELAAVNPSSVQGYFRYKRHWFYDLRDILVQSGIPSAALTGFDSALSRCVDYEAATEKFISIDIRTHCGLSMYLPANGSSSLNSFYKSLSWNEATGLVE